MLLCAVLITILSAGLFVFAAAEENYITLAFPGQDWALRVNAPGFKTTSTMLAPNGKAKRLWARNNKAKCTMLLYLEDAGQRQTAQSSKSYFLPAIKRSKAQISNMQTKSLENREIAEYMYTGFRGQRLKQKNYNIFAGKENFRINVYLGIPNFTPEDEPLVNNLINSIEFVENKVEDAKGLFMQGNYYMNKKDYKQAIEYYSNALKANDQQKQLTLKIWRELVDSLGLAYRNTRQHSAAIDTFEYAILQDSNYAWHYYNAARSTARLSNEEKTLSLLKQAYNLQDKLPYNGFLPNPLEDKDFQQIIKAKAFRKELVNTLGLQD